MAVEVTNQTKGKNAAQLADLLRTKSDELQKFMDSRKIEKDGQASYDFTLQEVEDVREKNDELTEIGIELDKAREVERIALSVKAANDRAEKQINRPRFATMREQDADGMREDRGPVKSWGELIVASKAYQEA